MKNKTLLSFSKQAAFIFEAAHPKNHAISPPTALKSESEKGFFLTSLLSYSNTYIYLAIGKAFYSGLSTLLSLSDSKQITGLNIGLEYKFAAINSRRQS